MNIKTEDLNFELPEKLIALSPEEKRDHCRLLWVNRNTQSYKEKRFYHLEELLQPGDVLVFNDTLVDRARLYGTRNTGSRHEVVLISSPDLKQWEALASKSKKLSMGTRLNFSPTTYAEITENKGGGKIKLIFNQEMDDEILNQIAELPLPPYIRKKRDYQNRDENDYQTVYAKHKGSKAAPTAGLHFTRELIKKLQSKGIETAFVQLFVSLGTFEPIKTEYVDDHAMHSEAYWIPDKTATLLNKAKQDKRRIIAVGTTVIRALESSFDGTKLQAGGGETKIFIKPGYDFKVVNSLITNFHTPGSTLLLLVGAMLGMDFLWTVYRFAVREEFRFFSYGDAMWIE